MLEAEIIQTKVNGNIVWGLLIEVNGNKVFHPCNDLIWDLKDELLITGKLSSSKIQIKFIE